MAKLKPDAIVQADLIAFLDTESDFSFEVTVLKLLVELGFKCDHGGTYEDPITKKQRQFDIRAKKENGNRVIRLAVECKNLGDNFPLLISCLPRREEESFHEVIVSINPLNKVLRRNRTISRVPERTASLIPESNPSSRALRMDKGRSFYNKGGPVGKSCDQVGRSHSGNEILSSDSETYEKWYQALSSAKRLVDLARSEWVERSGILQRRPPEKKQEEATLTLVFPVVVVPNGRLWIAQFDDDGSRLVDPERTDRCSYFVNRVYPTESPNDEDHVILSHLEFMTFDGLKTWLDGLCGHESAWEGTFASSKMLNALAESELGLSMPD